MSAIDRLRRQIPAILLANEKEGQRIRGKERKEKIMGFFSSLMEAAEAAVPWSTVEAEAPAEVETEGVKVG